MSTNADPSAFPSSSHRTLRWGPLFSHGLYQLPLDHCANLCDSVQITYLFALFVIYEAQLQIELSKWGGYIAQMSSKQNSK